MAPVVITIIMLVFAEITPKTYAAMKPERVAFPASVLLKPLQVLLAPLVWMVNGVSMMLLRLGGIRPHDQDDDHLSPEELRTVVNEAGGLIPENHQKMLLNILDLETVTVEDIMVPRNEMVGIDLEDDMHEILTTLRASQHTRLPVFNGDPNNMIGLLHLRKLSRLLLKDDINKAELMQHTVEPYFVPEGTSLHQQLINFQNAKRRIGIVVDEYGGTEGLITVKDIMEELVGDLDDENEQVSDAEDVVELVGGRLQLDARMEIVDMDEALIQGLGASADGDYETLGGFVLDFCGKVPAEGEQLNLETGARLVVTKSDGRRVQRLTFIPKDELSKAV